MNQAASNMIAVAQQPKDHEDREDSPKHFFLFLRTVAPGLELPRVLRAATAGRLVPGNRLCLCLPDFVQERMSRGWSGNAAAQNPARGDVWAIDGDCGI